MNETTETIADVFLKCLKELGNKATAAEVADYASEAYGSNREAVRKRRFELVKDGRVIVIGKRNKMEVLSVATKDEISVQERLSPAEQAELDQHEAGARENLQAWKRAGEHLWEIRRKRLYRQTHTDFRKYCKDRFGITGTHGERLAVAFDVYKLVNDSAPIGAEVTESQLRPLTKLRDENGDLDATTIESVWWEVLEVAETDTNGNPKITAAKVEEKVREYLQVDELATDQSEDDGQLVTLQEALRAASRCKSIDADYLSRKTGIAKAKIQGWLELSAESSGYKAVLQDDKTYAVHRVRIKSDAQKIKEVKNYSLHGDATPAEHLAADLDSIANTIQGVISLYSPGCKDFSAWNRLTPEDRRNLHFLLTSAQAKVNQQFPYFIGLVQ